MNAHFDKTDRQTFARRFAGKHLVLATVVTLAGLCGVARAESPTPDPYTHMAPSTRTRAEVLAELRVAQANGEMARLLGVDEGAYPLLAQPWHATRTRAEVRAEVLAARQVGELNAMSGEDSGSFHFARVDSRAVARDTHVAAVGR